MSGAVFLFHRVPKGVFWSGGFYVDKFFGYGVCKFNATGV
jgi:hypothetical protein